MTKINLPKLENFEKENFKKFHEEFEKTDTYLLMQLIGGMSTKEIAEVKEAWKQYTRLVMVYIFEEYEQD